MQDLIWARAVHVLGVVVWIGGVSMVTTVLLPAVRRLTSPEERVTFFEKLESGFARQARIVTLLTGASGFYMLYALRAWNRYQYASYWWVHAMTLVWLIFTVMLFVLEPLFLERWFLKTARTDPERTFARIRRLHWFLLTISLVTVAAAVAGSHGFAF